MNFKISIAFVLVGAFFSGIQFTSPTPVQAQKAMAEDCTQVVKAAWLGRYTAEASTQGECGLGELVLTVRNQNGDIEFSDTFGPSDLFGFYDIFTFQDMNLALTDWVSNYADESSTAKLPPWPVGADGPEAGEFPFYVEEGVSQALYEEIRAQDRPMVCFIQGGESLLCLVQHPETGDLEALGVQTFPG
jgi:hypothetical protein